MTKKKNALRTWAKRVVLALLGLGVVALVVLSVMPKPVPVDIVQVERGPLVDTVDETGKTRVKDRYVVSAPIGGNVARIELHAGETVEAGAVVARIAPFDPGLLDVRSRAEGRARLAAAQAAQQQARATIARAEAALAFAQRDAERSARLAEQGGVSEVTNEQAQLSLRTRREELTSARFGARVAAHEVAMARAALGRMDGSSSDPQMEVPSPVDGRILRVIQESEGVVQPGTPLVEVGDPAALEIVVDVLTADAVEIQPGARVVIAEWGGGQELRGQVRLVEPSAFSRVSALGVEEQRVNVIIDLLDPHATWSALGDGYGVEARIVVWEAEDVPWIPASAVFRHGDGWAVFQVVDSVARRVSVEVGRRTSLEVEIQGGLEVGAEVITHPSDQVDDGVEIRRR